MSLPSFLIISISISLSSVQIDLKLLAADQIGNFKRHRLTSLTGNINCYPNSNRMPLFTVIDYHRADLLDWILELKDKDPKIDFNFRDQVGNNCLHRMIISGFSSQFPLIKLISKGVSTYACNHKNQLPIDLIHDDSMAKEYGTLLSFTPLNVRTKLLRSAVIADAPKLVSTHLQICNDSGGNNRDDLNNALYLTTKYCSGQVAEQ